MPSYAVTGATRGIGLGFIENLSADSHNQVFALIRSLATAGPLQELAAKRTNIQIIVTDLSSPDNLSQTTAKVAQATGGGLDVLILNAGSAEPDTRVLPPSAFKPEDLAKEVNDNVQMNLINNIYVINTFLPLIRKGTGKKILFVSSNSSDVEFTRVTGFATLMGYSAAKAGMNVVITKYAAEMAPEGIKLLSMSPGWVNTDAAKLLTGDPEVRKAVLGMFRKVDPRVEGPISIEKSVAAQLKLVEEMTAEDSGKFVTHNGSSHNGSPEWF